MSIPRYRRLRGSVSTITYHLVFCPKFRRKVLVGAVASRFEELAKERLGALGCALIAIETMPDHVHLFVTALPVHAPQHIVNQIKGYTSRILRTEFPELRRRLPSLWSRSYYVGSAGAVSSDTIQHYIEQQRRS